MLTLNYPSCCQDDKYHQQLRQLEELEQKLRYIKKLVVEYDNSLINACE